MATPVTPPPVPVAATPRPGGVGTLAPERSADRETATPPAAGPTALHPLAKPADKPATPPTGRAGTPGTTAEGKIHTVVAGDTFSSLAVKYLGHAKYADLISKANPDLDPKRLRVGAKIRIPPPPTQDQAAASPAPAAVPPANASADTAKTSPGPRGTAGTRAPLNLRPGQQTYTVKPGDSWMSLARRFLGSDREWVRLYELNKERVRSRDTLTAGTVLVLPEDAKVPATEESGDSAKPGGRATGGSATRPALARP